MLKLLFKILILTLVSTLLGMRVIIFRLLAVPLRIITLTRQQFSLDKMEHILNPHTNMYIYIPSLKTYFISNLNILKIKNN